jgi:hypothetical protein
MSITLESRITRAPDVLHQRVRGEAVLLDLVGENYYGLNEVGARIWELLDADLTLLQIADMIAAEHDAEPARVQGDLRALADRLVEAGLAVVASP